MFSQFSSNSWASKQFTRETRRLGLLEYQWRNPWLAPVPLDSCVGLSVFLASLQHPSWIKGKENHFISVFCVNMYRSPKYWWCVRYLSYLLGIKAIAFSWWNKNGERKVHMWYPRDIDVEVWIWVRVYLSLTQRISLSRERGGPSKYLCSLLMLEGDVYCHGMRTLILSLVSLPLSHVYFLFLSRSVFIPAFQSFSLSRYIHLSAFTCGPTLVNPELASCPIKEGWKRGQNPARESRSLLWCAVLTSHLTCPFESCVSSGSSLPGLSLPFTLFSSFFINTWSTHTTFTSRRVAVWWRL